MAVPGNFFSLSHRKHFLQLMKIPTTLLTVIVIMAVIFPMSAFSQDQKKDEKKPNGGHQQQAAPHHAAPQGHAANVQHQGGRVGSPSQQGQVSHSANVQQAAPQRSYSGGNVSHGQQKHAQGSSPQVVSNNGSVQSHHQSGGSAVTPQVAQSRGSHGHGGGYAGQVAANSQYNGGNGGGHQGRGGYVGQVTPNTHYNSGNNYGGNWYPATSHNDWNQNNLYYWNNHNYCWYQGGWLIIDAGFNPYYVNTGYSGYSNNGSIVSSVQASLANQGYYDGPVDGMMGRGTRRAIANYQGDHNLNVTGHINDDLLESLQIQ